MFDENPALLTNTWVNTIDADEPASSVQALPSITTAPRFLVRWSGQDEAEGSGIVAYDVFVSDGSSYQPWLQGTTATAAVFSGQFDRRYSFYSIAIDAVGHRQRSPAATHVDRISPCRPSIASTAVNCAMP